MTQVIDVPQDSIRCMNGCDIKGTFEANREEQHTLRTRFFEGVTEDLGNNMYFQKLPVVAQPKKTKRSNEKSKHQQVAGRLSMIHGQGNVRSCHHLFRIFHHPMTKWGK